MDRQGWDERYAARDQAFVRGPNPFVEAELSAVPPGRALELAAGEGRHAIWLASAGWKVVAVDFSEVGLRRAQARARAEGHTVHFGLADVHTLRLPPRRFDLILATFFHPRPAERVSLYPAMARALAPGGSLLLVSYDLANLTIGTGGPKDPDFLLNPPVLAAELDALGLTVVRAESVPLHTTDAEGQEVDVVDSVIRAVRPA